MEMKKKVTFKEPARPTSSPVIQKVAYLEFLYSSEFNFGVVSPRLKYWSANVIQAFTLIDAKPGAIDQFGRLPVKHLCCTPFKDCFKETTFYRGPKYGLSLNEALLGPSVRPPILDRNFPNFDLIGNDEKGYYPGEDDFFTPTGLHKGFVKSSELIEQAQYSTEPRDNVEKKQLIFPSTLEHNFYSLLTSNISKITFSPRIFERDGIWVDQRTLSLSMMTGGWCHFRVMDCFCTLFTYERNYQVQNFIYKMFFSNVTSCILMNQQLDTKNYKIDFLKIVGVNPENGGLVHIPCFIEKQWILIVANFDQKRFDVLSPEYGADITMTVINTVVYNFRLFFLQAYPSYKKFNIRDFPVCYINVPKQQSKVDSGIFVLSFMETYDGITINKFSNADIQALREKKMFHLLFSKENKAKADVVSNFRRQFNIPWL